MFCLPAAHGGGPTNTASCARIHLKTGREAPAFGSDKTRALCGAWPPRPVCWRWRRAPQYAAPQPTARASGPARPFGRAGSLPRPGAGMKAAQALADAAQQAQPAQGAAQEKPSSSGAAQSVAPAGAGQQAEQMPATEDTANAKAVRKAAPSFGGRVRRAAGRYSRGHAAAYLQVLPAGHRQRISSPAETPPSATPPSCRTARWPQR